MLKTEKIDIGCAIHGLNAKSVTSPQLLELKDLLYKNRLIVLKDQVLTEQEYCDFAERLGSPVPYLQDCPNVKRDGKQIGVPNTGGYWHSDTSFEADPKFITMLMPKILPRTVARTTRFIDMAEVYAALPQATKDRLAGAQFIHSGRWRFKIRPDCVGMDIFGILQLLDHHSPPVRHPAVIEHPYTKEQVLYGNRGFTIGIADRSLDESAELLREIFNFAESSRFVREVRWSIGDVIIWDNRFLAHSSGRNEGPEEETMMYRITLKDEFPLCASCMLSGNVAA